MNAKCILFKKNNSKITWNCFIRSKKNSFTKTKETYLNIIKFKKIVLSINIIINS